MIRYAVTVDLSRVQIESAMLDAAQAAEREADAAIRHAAGVLSDPLGVGCLGPLTRACTRYRTVFRWSSSDPGAPAELVECDDDRWEVARYTFSRTGR